MTLNEVLKNTNYDVALFSEEARKYIEDAIVVKTVRGKEMAHITCLKRGKKIVLKPEEAVRQLYLYKLIHEYGYPVSRIEVEFPIHFGREVKRADIAIMDKDRPMVPYIIVELKNRSSPMARSSLNPTATQRVRLSVYGQMVSRFPTITGKTLIILSQSPIFRRLLRS